MKKKSAKKSNNKRVTKNASTLKTEPALAASAIASSPQPEGILTEGPYGQSMMMPHPENLLREAEEEPNYRDLKEYTQVIAKLRDKGFSFRDIADWLSERGVPVDHNAVYRVYTNSLSDEEAHLESLREQREAEEESMRNR